MIRQLRDRWLPGRLDAATMRRVEEAVARFDAPEGRFLTADELVSQAADLVDAPLHLCFVDSPQYSGSLLGAAPGGPLVIAIDRSYRGSGPIETLVAGHELGHALGLDSGAAPAERIPARALAAEIPDLPPELVQGLTVLRTRCGGRSRAELACEYFGTLLVRRSIPATRSAGGVATSGLPGLDSSIGGPRS
jgi:hypothetical protein